MIKIRQQPQPQQQQQQQQSHSLERFRNTCSRSNNVRKQILFQIKGSKCKGKLLLKEVKAQLVVGLTFLAVMDPISIRLVF